MGVGTAGVGEHVGVGVLVGVLVGVGVGVVVGVRVAVGDGVIFGFHGFTVGLGSGGLGKRIGFTGKGNLNKVKALTGFVWDNKIDRQRTIAKKTMGR